MSDRYLFFDLDGTITDSSEGILNSVCYALQKCGIAAPPREQLLCFIGPPLVTSFADMFGMTREEALHAVTLYREYYFAKGIREFSVYDGISELLHTAKERGYRLVLATCKPQQFAVTVLTHCGLADCFEHICGPELDGTRGEKHEVIAYALQKCGNPSPEQVWMIGDRKDDVLGAAKNRIACAGVLWGFGSREELQQAGASLLFDSPENLSRFLWNQPSFCKE